MKPLKCLVFDIETAPMLAFVWGRKDQNIATNQIKADWYVLAWAAKWLEDPVEKVEYRDQRNAKNMEDDKQILKKLWQLLDEADIVITQNGKNFDSPKLNARFIMHGMPPPSPYKHLDTFQIARNAAKFTSNSLEFLTDKLCTKYKKLSHSKFPGQSLWTECLKGNKAAWDEMKRYNVHDVLATEELYSKLRAWAPVNAPSPFVVEDASKQCAKCGVTGKQIKQGTRPVRGFLVPRYQCLNCGSWAQGKKITEAA